ncbi:MAG TPA: putative peptidoglycan glycosyltransferase FtsW [Alphaproteobacteria bacterium]|nr:cell division protein FtsW [Micavibrio sp.]MBK9561793.1 cell division protein FtsW [Micavibrio sp.]HQX27094.1 putative peptidoglycan glycosyltransferase FtsW [Alphaproteobacteria bacterium]
MSMFSRTDTSFLGRWWWTVDRGLLAAFILLIVFGIVLVSTASPPVAETLGLNSYHFLKRHLMMLLPALGLLMGISMLSPRMIWRAASILFIASLAAMIVVLFHGVEIKGAQRWIHLFGFSLQPSELAKPSFAIVAAWFMSRQKENAKFPGNLIAAGLCFLTVGLLMLQPDLGMTIVVTCIWASQIFLAGFRFRILAIFSAIGAACLGCAYLFFEHVRYRVDRFFKPESGDNYQVDRSLEAFQNGGIAGTGPGQGTVKSGLPDAHADFIFSVAGEEMGLWFVLIIIAVFGFIMWRGLNRLTTSDNMFAVLAVGGLLTMFGLQALVHMGSAMNILPAKGMTLPFISYGGSSILSLGFSMGAVLALTRRQARGSVARAGMSSKARVLEAGNQP